VLIIYLSTKYPEWVKDDFLTEQCIQALNEYIEGGGVLFVFYNDTAKFINTFCINDNNNTINNPAAEITWKSAIFGFNDNESVQVIKDVKPMNHITAVNITMNKCDYNVLIKEVGSVEEIKLFLERIFRNLYK
jgi:hypothetical protein